MEELTIVMHDEMKKQTEHLRAIRNWVVAIGIIVVVIPIAGVFLYLLVVGLSFS